MRWRLAALCVVALAFAGCHRGLVIQGMPGRWIVHEGGFELRDDGTVAVRKGCLATEGLRWNGQRVSFSIHEDPQTPWAVYLFDENFAAARSRALRDVLTVENGHLIRRADKARGRWIASIVIRLVPVRPKGAQRTGLLARAVVSLGPSAIVGQIDEFPLAANLARGQWNRIDLDFSRGFGRCFVNGEPGGGFRYDPRVDGGIGFHVGRGAPLLIKDFAVGPIPVAAQQP